MSKTDEIYQQIIATIITGITQDKIAQLIQQESVKNSLDKTIKLITNTHQQLEQTKDGYGESNDYFSVSLPFAVPITHWLEYKTNSSIVSAIDSMTISEKNINQSNLPIFTQLMGYTPQFCLPNLKVAESYSSAIEVKSFSADINVIIEQVLFNHTDLNLDYNNTTKTIAGTPQRAGTYTILIKWRVEGYATESTEIEIIVNPDPNSLWKDIPADEKDPYFKPSLANQYIESTEIKIAAASRRGRSHAHVGSFRDDDFFVEHLANGWNITIVADGAGSASNSRKGSKLAVTTIGEYLKHQLLDTENQSLVNLVTQWDHIATQQVGLQFKNWFRDAAVLAIKQLEVEADKTNHAFKTYSTTVLAAVTLKLGNDFFAATFSVGDGAIAAFSYKDNLRLLSVADSGEFAGQTRFLDNTIMRELDFYNRIRIGKWQDIDYFFLMTDGISDPKFETDFQLNNKDKWYQLTNELTPYLETATDPSKALLDWMTFASPGNHDDRTLIVLW